MLFVPSTVGSGVDDMTRLGSGGITRVVAIPGLFVWFVLDRLRLVPVVEVRSDAID